MSLVEWSRSFWQAPPIGFILRSAQESHWLRIHFFAAKRYPETPADHDQVTDRFQTCGDHLFAPSAQLILYRYAFHADPDYEMESIAVPFEASRAPWLPGQFTSDLRKTACDEAPSFLLFDPTSENAMAPYPGGIDLFLRDATVRDQLYETLAPWRSAREDGL